MQEEGSLIASLIPIVIVILLLIVIIKLISFIFNRRKRIEKREQDDKVQNIINKDSNNESKLNEISDYFSQLEYVVTSRTNSSLQMTRKKQFSFLWAFIWLLGGGIGLPVYIIYYLAKKDDIFNISLS